MFTPYDFQDKAVADARAAIAAGKRRVIIVAPTGSGKTVMAAMITGLARSKDKQVLFLANRRELVFQAQRTINSTGLTTGIVMAGEACDHEAAIQIASMQTYSRRMDLEELTLNRWWHDADIIFVDECFTGETKVSTPSGEKTIDSVRCGDIVYSMAGTGEVLGVSCRPAMTTYIMEFSNGRRTECTGNHRFFTRSGWKEARAMVQGEDVFSVKNVSDLWKSVQTMDEIRGDENGQCLFGGDLEQARVLLSVLCEEITQPNEQSPGKDQNEGQVARNQTHAYQERREWAIAALTAACSAPCTWGGMGVGGGNCDWFEKNQPGIPNLLQDRPCQQGLDDRDRDRRGLSHLNREKGEGQEENGFFNFTRVVGVSRVERKSPISVFNLHVSGHPSFFANGVAVHNCHSSISPSYQKILKAYDQSKVVIGLTATPTRQDGRGLGEFYDAIIPTVGIAELIDKGKLVPFRYFAPSKPDLDNIPLVAGDYNLGELERRTNKPKLVGDIYQNWAEICPERSTIVFATSVAHSIALENQFRSNGVEAVHIDAKTNHDIRSAAFDAFTGGELQVIVNVGIACEGTDLPIASCIVLARPTKSLGRFIQMGGRGSRLYPGKHDCCILDFAGCLEEHGLLEWPHEWSLDGKARVWSKAERVNKEKGAMKCQVCNRVLEEGIVCPDCGSVMKRHGKPIEVEEGILKEIGKTDSVVDKRIFWGMLLRWARFKEYSPGWCAHKYKEKFGVWPRGGGDTEVEPDQAFINYLKHLNIKYHHRRR